MDGTVWGSCPVISLGISTCEQLGLITPKQSWSLASDYAMGWMIWFPAGVRDFPSSRMYWPVLGPNNPAIQSVPLVLLGLKWLCCGVAQWPATSAWGELHLYLPSAFKVWTGLISLYFTPKHLSPLHNALDDWPDEDEWLDDSSQSRWQSLWSRQVVPVL